MNIKSLFAAATLISAMFSMPVFAKTVTAVGPDVWEQRCMGWSSEISEIAGALHEATQDSGTEVSEALYSLEDAAQERCAIGYKADKLLARSVEQEIADAAAEIEKVILTKQGSSSAERVLVTALLKLVRSQIQVVPSTTQG